MKSLIDRLHERFASTEIHNADIIPDTTKWDSFLAKLPTPKDSVDEAYNKYRCRMYYFPLYKRVIANIFGFAAIPVMLFFLVKSDKSILPMQKGVAVLEKSRDVPQYDDLFPETLYKQYKIEISENFNKKFGILCKEAKTLFWKSMRKHPFSFFYNYFVYMELAAHSYFLLKYNPEVTIVYVNNRNVASPIITELYENDGRQFISFMHGEFLRELFNGYMSFSKYYIWNSTYISMFKSLNCNIKKYEIYTPGKLKKKWNLESITPEYYCTYYLSGQSKNYILKLGGLLETLEKRGKKCKVRPHPRNLQYTKEILNSFNHIRIENSKEVSMKDSLASTQYAVGLNTTVLSEAYIEGRKVVIDDISDPGHFEDSKNRGAAAFAREHILFSNLIKMSENRQP